jgi:hypothetical protein
LDQLAPKEKQDEYELKKRLAKKQRDDIKNREQLNSSYG